MGRMTIIAGVLLIAACGSNENAVCKHLVKLCGDDIIDDSCASDLKDLKDVLGASYGKAMTCAAEASSCPEVAGCFAGGFGHAADRWQQQFEHGVDRVMEHDDPRLISTHFSEDASQACTKFESNGRDARWDGCTDHVKRELSCNPFGDDELSCDCLEDGVEKWSFTAKDPPLTTREDASRVARNNCHMGSFDKL
jgi:hypothetical protein